MRLGWCFTILFPFLLQVNSSHYGKLEDSVSVSRAEMNPVINAGHLGQIRGFLSKTNNTGRPFLQFLGIPYAQSTEGEGRFMPSTLRTGRLAKRGQIFDATTFGSPCPQEAGPSSENCLFMNIATANTKSWTLAPVIVYLHGSAFVFGNANNFDGRLLLKRNVVVVSIHYRLGVFGYLGFAHDLAPGNAALYDALTALTWVQKNIHHFGGNHKLVTLSGQSAGSAMVTQLLLSPLSVGLFHRVIALSGTALTSWATTSNPVPTAIRIASMVNCTKPTVVDNKIELPAIMACLRKVSVQDLITAQVQFQKAERTEAKFGFILPSITFNALKTVPTILPDYPINILRRKRQMRVPLMIGATKQDGDFGLGLSFAYYLVPNGLWKNPTFVARDLIQKLMEASEYQLGNNDAQQDFANTFLQNCSRDASVEKALPGVMDAYTVLLFKAAAYQFAKLHSKTSPTFLYSFNFKGTHTKHSPMLPFPGGVSHSDDTIYLFRVFEFDFNSDEKKVSDNMVEMWGNFAATGFPSTLTSNFVWPPFTHEEKYLIIDKNLQIDNEYQQRWVGASQHDLGEGKC